MKNILIISLAALAGFTSCKKEGCTDTNAINYSSEAEIDNGSCQFEDIEAPPSNQSPILIGTATTANNETVSLYADDELSTGYTKLYVSVINDSGQTVSGANVTFAPLMDMGTMQHACPIEQPTFNSSSEQYVGAVVFIMSSTAGTWTMDINVDGSPASFSLDVAESPTKLVGAYTGTDGAAYFISLMRPENWVVGMNDLEIMIHRRDNMMSFPADNDFDVTLTTEMVSMGHSSPDNVDPVFISNGHYNGDVNLTMAGDWRLHFEISKSGTLIHDDAFLDILF